MLTLHLFCFPMQWHDSSAYTHTHKRTPNEFGLAKRILSYWFSVWICLSASLFSIDLYNNRKDSFINCLIPPMAGIISKRRKKLLSHINEDVSVQLSKRRWQKHRLNVKKCATPNEIKAISIHSVWKKTWPTWWINLNDVSWKMFTLLSPVYHPMK